MKHIIISIASVIALTFLVSAQKNKTVENKSLKETVWELAKISGFEMEKLDKKPYIVFANEANKVHGLGGCNTFGGKYEIDGNKLKVSDVFSTMMACIPGMETENRFVSAINKVNEYEIKDGLLLLKQNNTILLTFKPSKSKE